MPKKCKWRIIEASESDVMALSRAMGISPILSRLLINRGIVNAQEGKKVLYPRLDDLRSPFLFEEMNRACLRIHQALTSKEKIMIFGDWDVDGLTATALLVRLLRQLKGDVVYHIPKDFGYGLDRESINDARRHGVGLIISVDCGASNAREVEYASSLGLDCIITDHHPPPKDRARPPAVAVINPRESNSYPDIELAGVGIAFKLGQALVALSEGEEIAIDLSHPKMDYYFKTYLDLVSLGTIADLGKLIGENRVLTRLGLAGLSQTKKVGLRVILHSLGLLEKTLGEWEVAFKLAPALNSAGRMNQGHLGIELLTTKKKEVAERLTQEILSLNEKRRLRSDMDTALASEYIEQELDLEQEKVLVVPLEEREGGVTGIVANRLLEQYSRPVVVFACKGSEVLGSARSNVSLDLNFVLSQCTDLLIKFGGHKRAAGMTILKENIPLFRERINELAGEIPFDTEEVVIDQEISSEEVTPILMDEIDNLRPFGEGNPEPLFLLRNIRPLSIRRMGQKDQHLKITLGLQESIGLEAIGWRMGELRDEVLNGADLVAKLQKNLWGGKEQTRLIIEEINPKDQ